MKKRLPSSTWVVVPAYNETGYISDVLEKILKFTQNIIVVDDGSRDSSALKANTKAQYVLRHRLNLGKGAALKTGCDFAFYELKAKAVVVMDADDQHDPACLPEFQKALDQKSQVVFGVRPRNSQMPLLKRLGNVLASALVWISFGIYIPDIPCGYKAFTKKAYQNIRWTSRGYHVEMEIASRVGKFKLKHQLVQIPLIYHDHDKGMTILDVLDVIFHIGIWRLSL